MTKLDAVLAEEWAIERHVVIRDAHGPVGAFDRLVLPDHEADEMDRVRAAIAVLGKRALALILEHEWSGGEDGGCCVECYGPFDGPYCVNGGGTRHHPDCEWGKIVKAAKALG